MGTHENAVRPGEGSKAFDGSEESAVDEIDIARIERVYRYVHDMMERNVC